MTERKVLIGTSGWGYDEWVGPFYPRGLRKDDYLVYYSEIFYTNEINKHFIIFHREVLLRIGLIRHQIISYFRLNSPNLLHMSIS